MTRLAIPIACASASLAFLSSLIPILTGEVDWRQATTFTLTSPFPGWFGDLTSVMAGLYLIGFAAPAFEAAACHVGETIDPNRNVPRAMLASAAMAGVYFIVLPVVWLGVLGPAQLGKDLALGARADLRAAARQLRQGGRDLVHHPQHVPRNDAAVGRRGAHAVAAERGRAVAALPRMALDHGLPLDGHASDRRHGDHLPDRAIRSG